MTPPGKIIFSSSPQTWDLSPYHLLKREETLQFPNFPPLPTQSTLDLGLGRWNLNALLGLRSFPSIDLKPIRLEPVLKTLAKYVSDGRIYVTIPYRVRKEPYPVKSPLPATSIEYKLPAGFATSDLRFSNGTVDSLDLNFNPPIPLDIKLPLVGVFTQKIKSAHLVTEDFPGNGGRIEDPNDPFYLPMDEAHSKKGRLYVIFENGMKVDVTKPILQLLKPKGRSDQRFPVNISELFNLLLDLGFTARKNKLAGKAPKVNNNPLDFEKMTIVRAEFSVKPVPIRVGPLVLRIDPTINGEKNVLTVFNSQLNNLHLLTPEVREAVLESKTGERTFVANGIAPTLLSIQEKRVGGEKTFFLFGKQGSMQSFTMDLGRARNKSENTRWSYLSGNWNPRTGGYRMSLGNLRNSRITGTVPEADLAFEVGEFSSEEAFGPLRSNGPRDAEMRTAFERRDPFEANEARIERTIRDGRETYEVQVAGAWIKAKEFSATTESASLNLKPTELKVAVFFQASRLINGTTPLGFDPQSMKFRATIASHRFNILSGSFDLPDTTGKQGAYGVKISPTAPTPSYVSNFTLVLNKEEDRLLSTGDLHLYPSAIRFQFGQGTNLPLAANLLFQNGEVSGSLERLVVTELFRKKPLHRRLDLQGNLRLMATGGEGEVTSSVYPNRFGFKSEEMTTTTLLRQVSIQNGSVDQIELGNSEFRFSNLRGDAGVYQFLQTKLRVPRLTVSLDSLNLDYRSAHQLGRDSRPIQIGTVRRFSVHLPDSYSGSRIEVGNPSQNGKVTFINSLFWGQVDQTDNLGLIYFDPNRPRQETILKFLIGRDKLKFNGKSLGNTEVKPEPPTEE